MAELPAPLIDMKWSLATRPLDLHDCPEGAYVCIIVGGRDAPTYVVHVSPNGNWGFTIESCWGVYALIELDLQVPPCQS
jgi:hypothetical protein